MSCPKDSGRRSRMGRPSQQAAPQGIQNSGNFSYTDRTNFSHVGQGSQTPLCVLSSTSRGFLPSIARQAWLPKGRREVVYTGRGKKKREACKERREANGRFRWDVKGALFWCKRHKKACDRRRSE